MDLFDKEYNSLYMLDNYYLSALDPLTTTLRNAGIDTWPELCQYVRNLPYGRNSSRDDLSLVITECRGTCSSKHALLKKVGDGNDIKNINLIMIIYKMNPENTPKIAKVLERNNVLFFPEAHCCLKIDNQLMDFTTIKSSIENIKDDILEIFEIDPEYIVDQKVKYHKEYIQYWLHQSKVDHHFKNIWNIREACIQELTN